MPVIKKEILTEYSDSDDIVLSYYTDANMHTHTLQDTQTTGNKATTSNNYSYTLVIGNGSSYVYPRAMFIGNKQVYPPVGLTTLGSIRPLSGSDTKNFTLFNSKYISRLSISDKTYLLPKIFNVQYATNMSNSYTTVQIPSFNPITESNNSQYAYFYGSLVIIKDPALPNYKVPTGVMDYGSNYDSTYFTYFSVAANGSVCNANQTSWDTTQYPLSYTRTSANTYIHRRQFVLGNNTRIRTIRESETSNSTYYIFRYYYKGTEITNINDIAYIMPEYSIRTSEVTYTTNNSNNLTINSIGIYPNCTFFFDNISSPTGRFTLTIPSSNFYESPSGNHASIRFYDMGSLFNIHLIKVNAGITNTQMQAFGQSSFYYNYKSLLLNGIVDFIDYPNYTVNTVFTNASNIDTFLIKTSQLNEEHITNRPKKNSIITSINNSFNTTDLYKRLAAAKINHKFANNLNINNQNQFTYTTYANAMTTSDVSSLSFTTNTSSGTLTIQMNASAINSRTTVTASSALANTYTYCYIAADVISKKTSNTAYVITNRVLSDTYLCIKCEARTGTGTTTTNYYTEYF